MAELAVAAQIVGTVLSVVGTIQDGNAANKAAQFEAAQYDYNAKQEQATAQRRAAEERRQSGIVQSRARAVAGSSGGGVSDPTVSNIIGDLAAEGEYRALTAMFEGDDAARSLKTAADFSRYQGAQAKRSSKIKAATTLLSQGSSMYDKYAPKTSFGPGFSSSQSADTQRAASRGVVWG